MTNRHVYSRAGFGGIEAHELQMFLPAKCIANNTWTVDLTDGVLFDWRALVASMSEENASLVVGPGIARVCFRLLRDITDSNYRSMTPATPWRHVLQFEQSSGITHILHYHKTACQNFLEWSIERFFRSGDRL